MSGAGNDFIIIEARKDLIYNRFAVKICDRTNGIGADGLLILDTSKRADYKMRIINADGSRAEMCGNGARCLAAYIVRHKNPGKKLFSIETLAGRIWAEAEGDIANVLLNDPVNYKPDIPLEVNGQEIHVHFINTGVPHTIVYVDKLKRIDVSGIGQAIRSHGRFAPRGVNVNFVEQLKPNLIAVRTYERGVENETKACGTGSVAAALVTYLKSNPKIKNRKKAQVKVRTSGKEILEVTFTLDMGEPFRIWLKGNTRRIAEGKYYL